MGSSHREWVVVHEPYLHFVHYFSMKSSILIECYIKLCPLGCSKVKKTENYMRGYETECEVGEDEENDENTIGIWGSELGYLTLILVCSKVFV